MILELIQVHTLKNFLVKESEKRRLQVWLTAKLRKSLKESTIFEVRPAFQKKKKKNWWIVSLLHRILQKGATRSMHGYNNQNIICVRRPTRRLHEELKQIDQFDDKKKVLIKFPKKILLSCCKLKFSDKRKK